jgi:hypothetical protein
MWLGAGFVVALFLAGLASASAEDDGPPLYAPSPIDYIDHLPMPANPPSASAVANSQPEFPWEGEPLGQPSSRSGHKPNVTAASNK